MMSNEASPTTTESSHPTAPQQASQRDAFARVALDNIQREYPYAAHHVQRNEADLQQPREQHPSFASSFDWHSSVHMHWLLATLVEDAGAQDAGAQDAGAAAPGGWREQALSILSTHLAPERIAVEAAYLRANPTWERPYGWAWAAMLAQRLHTATEPQLRALAAGVEPLAEAVFDLTLEWLPKSPAPVLHGVHKNTAFGLRRILLAAKTFGREDVVAAITASARAFFAADTAWPFYYERSGEDFLSPGFCEADLMLLVLDDTELAAWLPAFFSQLDADCPVLTPVAVLDASDGYQSHLNGLGLTVAASGHRVAAALDRIGSGELASILRSATPRLMQAGLRAAVAEEYMDSHWLATFAWEALTEIGAAHE